MNLSDATYRLLIGKTARVEGRDLRIVEMLTADESVILENLDSRSSLQENQFGDVHRRGAQTHSIPLRSEVDQQQLHPVLRQFLSPEECLLLEQEL